MSAPHPIREEDLELLALGVIAPEETEPLRAHIASCAECSREFAEAQGRVALFALAAPPQDPPTSAKQRLFDKIRSERIDAATFERPSTPTRVARPAAHWWNTVWVPAAAVLAVATIILWINDRHLGNQLQQMRGAEQNFQAQMQHEQALVSFLSAQDTKTVSLGPTPRVPKAWASLKYNSRMGMICYTGDLPAPPPNKEYQMWIVPMVGSPISAGAFMPASFTGGHMCMAKMPEGISCKAFGVTIEPMGGMPHPTGPVVLASGL
ncbi:MAG: anti-sigma factor [Candidatus Acidiferrales bacterium]